MMFHAESWSLDLDKRVFYRNARPERLQRGVMDLLLYIVRHRGRTVLKQELIDNVWGGRAVSDAALYNRVSVLRRAIGDGVGERRQVTWDYGRGLRFVDLTPRSGPSVARLANAEVSSALRGAEAALFYGVADIEALRPALGIYHSFYRTPSWPNVIKCGVTVLSEEPGRVAVRTAEYGQDDVVGVRQRARYRGFAHRIEDRIYVIEQNTRPPYAVCLLAMDAPHPYQRNVLTGMMMGSSWRLGGAPYSTRVIWRRVPGGMTARDALKQSGPIVEDSPLLDDTVRQTLQRDPMVFHEPAGAV
ncbi:MAG: winged helix-turn-helix domain-containing protein [Pseudomonadota bacterium]